ncbi:MAG: phage regulatory CII family protein [Acidobacteriota bacterium]
MTQNKDKLSQKDYEDVRRALYQLPRRYAGQMKELADTAGINYDRLRRATSDVDTTREGRDLSLIESLRLMQAADDYALLSAICAELGFETPRRTKINYDGKFDCETLMEEALAISSALGVLSAAIKDAVADDRISENERRRILEALENAQQELEKIRHLTIKIS